MASKYLGKLVLFFVFNQVFGELSCGLRAAIFDKTLFSANVSHTRIVGGSAVPSFGSAWPWMVTLANGEIPEVKLCGGALISPNYVLTAAHCFKFFETAKWIVELGRYDSSKPENYTTQRIAKKIIIHPRFNDTEGVFNDLALVRLNASVTFDTSFNYTLNSVCLSNYKLLDEFTHNQNTHCMAIGFGAEKKDSENPFGGSARLKQVELPLVGAEKCFEAYGFKYDANTQLCAGGRTEGGAGTCYGDSGSPLQCFVNGRWHLVGVTSYGKACARPSTPDVFTKVAAYSDWINAVIKEKHKI